MKTMERHKLENVQNVFDKKNVIVKQTEKKSLKNTKEKFFQQKNQQKNIFGFFIRISTFGIKSSVGAVFCFVCWFEMFCLLSEFILALNLFSGICCHQIGITTH